MSESNEQGRVAQIERKTGETDVRLTINLDGKGKVKAETGILFLDHMVDALGRHSHFDIDVTATGDVTMDPHHTAEDVGITLGAALKQALGDRTGINRYGFAYAPLDEALARVVIDCSGRPFLEYRADMPEPVIGSDFASSLVEEFWRALVVNAGLTVHIDLIRSRNAHHAAEAIFKAAALALKQATRISSQTGDVPSTKGTLQ